MHVKPAAVSYVNVGQKEFIETMKAVEGSGAEVVVMVLNPAEGKDFVLTRLSRTKHIPVVSHWGITGGTFGKDLASQLKNFDFAFFQTPGFLGNKRVRAVDLARRYLETYGGGEVADINAPAAVIRTYDMMMLLGQALELAEKSPKLSMREALEKVSEFDGAVTTYRKPFANALHEGFDPKLYTLGRFDDKGRIVPVTSKH